MRANRDRNQSIVHRLLVCANVILPAALVFIAYDLSVEPEASLLRGPDTDRNELEIVSIDRLSDELPPYVRADGVEDADPSRHIMFGVEAVAEELALAGNDTETLSSGGWAGHFAGLLEGDVAINCWSPFEVNVRLRQEGDRIYGPGSYLVDPSKCSSHTSAYLAFFTADGMRSGNRVTLEINNDDTGDLALIFSGVVAGNSLVGVFTAPNGAAVSGTTVLKLVDEGQPAAGL